MCMSAVKNYNDKAFNASPILMLPPYLNDSGKTLVVDVVNRSETNA